MILLALFISLMLMNLFKLFDDFVFIIDESFVIIFIELLVLKIELLFFELTVKYNFLLLLKVLLFIILFSKISFESVSFVYILLLLFLTIYAEYPLDEFEFRLELKYFF